MCEKRKTRKRKKGEEKQKVERRRRTRKIGYEGERRHIGRNIVFMHEIGK